MYEPGSRIRADAQEVVGPRRPADTENACRWTDKADMARRNAPADPSWPACPDHGFMDWVGAGTTGLSRVAGPVLLCLTLFGSGLSFFVLR